MHRSVAEKKLGGLEVEGEDATKYFSNIEWPVSSFDEFVISSVWPRCTVRVLSTSRP